MSTNGKLSRNVCKITRNVLQNLSQISTVDTGLEGDMVAKFKNILFAAKHHHL